MVLPSDLTCRMSFLGGGWLNILFGGRLIYFTGYSIVATYSSLKALRNQAIVAKSKKNRKAT